MKRLLFAVFVFLFCNLTTRLWCQEESILKTARKKVLVYTTAYNTDYRLSLTDSVVFNAMGQPLETQVCVFVDPDKSFQTFLASAAL